MKFSVKNICVGDGCSPKIMGVVNISPESFFTDSFTSCEKIFEKVCAEIDAGADIIDIGARSTALHAPPLSVAEEKDRVVTALKELRGVDAVFSLDTMYPKVLDAALRFDLSIINDISGLTNECYAKVASDSGLPVIAMAAKKVPGDPLNFFETKTSLENILSRANNFGIEKIILDPGVGRWVPERTADADWELCRNFSDLKSFGCPLLAAVSRKTFIGEATLKLPQDRLYGTLGVLFYLLLNGADILRVHDVSAAKDLVAVYGKLGV